MNSRRTVIILLAALIAVVIAAVVIVLVVMRNADVESKRAECDKYAYGSMDYFVCVELAD